MRGSLCFWSAVALAFGPAAVAAIQLNVNSADSITAAASDIAPYIVQALDSTGDGTLPVPYYWWEAGVALDALVNYQYLTGDRQYDLLVQSSLFVQTGPNYDYMAPNQTKTEGNDDQGFFALSAMSAAEKGLGFPASSPITWVDPPIKVFDLQVSRWDTTSCSGGLKWQIFPFNAGYNYKNTASQGTFFQLAARLARFTGNQTYADWAERIWDWTRNVGLISETYMIYDGTDDSLNCSQINHIQWSANAGLFLYGSAVMYNITGSLEWLDRTLGLLNATSIFFTDSNDPKMYEVACQPAGTCNTDQRAFRAILARSMGATARMVPATADYIYSRLGASASGAALACSNTTGDNLICGSDWASSSYNGVSGVGEQLSALEVVQNLLLPVTPLSQAVTTPVTFMPGIATPGTTTLGTTTPAMHTPSTTTPSTTTLATTTPATATLATTILATTTPATATPVISTPATGYGSIRTGSGSGNGTMKASPRLTGTQTGLISPVPFTGTASRTTGGLSALVAAALIMIYMKC